MRCPCRKKSDPTGYSACCQPHHDGDKIPETAETLMRTRYCAFALKKAAYLKSTWHPSTRPGVIDFEPDQQWLRLRIKRAYGDDNQGWVSFEARSRVRGRSLVLNEVSRFLFQGGRWFYVDGEVSNEAP
ncbi:MAG: YchJ family protein [Hyphomicrobiaceae bacterium]